MNQLRNFVSFRDPQKITRVIIQIIINVIFCLLLLEVGAWGILKMRFKSNLNYSNVYKKYQSDLNSFNKPKPVRAHPFFGYVFTSFGDLYVNRAGFVSNYEYPFQRGPNDFVIGIFGASVGSNLAIFLEKSVEMKKNLIDQCPKLKNRRIIFLNFSLVAMKQPQQFAIYSHYAENLDISINIDGYKEASSNLPVEFPFWYDLLFNNNDNQLESYAQLKKTRDIQGLLVKLPLKFSVLSKSNFYYLVWLVSINTLDQRANTISQQLFVSSNPKKDELNHDADKATRIELEAKNWSKFSRLQALLAKSLNIPAIFLIQPSPIIKDSKILSNEEKEMLSSLVDRNEKEGEITRTYQLLGQEIKLLEKINSTAFNFSNVFHNHSETLYLDTYGHLNDHGQEIIAAEIVKLIAETMNKKK